ncbi:MAG: hypothetical protein KJO36_06110 [Acidimicrobiia bacterium]|nr:hypothetical protein [Acidimicrobiia bacterium]
MSSLKVNQTTKFLDGQSQSIGTTHETITVSGDMTTEGWCLIKNLDTTNYVEIGRDVGASFYPVMRLRATEFALFRWSPGVTLYAKADTAACVISKVLLDD